MGVLAKKHFAGWLSGNVRVTLPGSGHQEPDPVHGSELKIMTVVFIVLLAGACGTERPASPAVSSEDIPDNKERSMADMAEQYVKLVLAMGEHDAAYVDAYFGPAHWRK